MKRWATICAVFVLCVSAGASAAEHLTGVTRSVAAEVSGREAVSPPDVPMIEACAAGQSDVG